MDFRWTPGTAYDATAVERMKTYFPKPTEPPYEAWFMSGHKYLHWFVEQSIDEYDLSALESYLDDTACGIKNFGRYQEWVDWYHYLLPHLMPRLFEGSLLTFMLTHFVNLYPDGIIEAYPGFRDDILNTLPHALMSSELWTKGGVFKQRKYSLHKSTLPSAFNATMFFCLKYLNPDEITSWIESVAHLQDEFWRGEFTRWLHGMEDFIHIVTHSDPKPTRQNDRKQDIVDFLAKTGTGWFNDYAVFSGLYAETNLTTYLPQEHIDALWLAALQHGLI